MLSSTFLLFVASIPILKAQSVDSNGITLAEKVEYMERQLVDPTVLNSVVAPCGGHNFADPRLGEQTAAEWVRIVFHDAITKGIEGPGLGYVKLFNYVVSLLT
jgi:hypothetical protein